MVGRSKGGCIDCKRAKIKCDEAPLACGTCSRRGYVCQGYLTTETNPPAKITNSRNLRILKPKKSPHVSLLSDSCSGDSNRTCADHDGQIISPASTRSDERSFSFHKSRSALVTSNRQSSETPSHDAPLTLLQSISSLPPGSIPSLDGMVIEVYFSRHLAELAISPEFVDEMSSNILKVFYNDPQSVCDSLSAIGYIYMGLDSQSSIVPFLDRKARILARLRAMNGIGHNLEEMVVILLGLCALELIDSKSPPKETVLPALLINTAFTINYHVSAGKALSSVAKYFIRALARQDMMLALTDSRRPLIAIECWLDEECERQADRFMGYTSTMMPILADLSALAEDINQGSSQTRTPVDPANVSNPSETALACVPRTNNFEERALGLRIRILEWRPISFPNISFQSSKIFLFHAHSFQAAALLYLHRLIYPPGSSAFADKTALGMAHAVLMYISGTPSELKMSLWPLFIAATELINDDDRGAALRSFDNVFTQRGTVTSLRTKNFTAERVWKARDSGLDWNWRVLACKYPGECMPI